MSIGFADAGGPGQAEAGEVFLKPVGVVGDFAFSAGDGEKAATGFADGRAGAADAPSAAAAFTLEAPSMTLMRPASIVVPPLCAFAPLNVSGWKHAVAPLRANSPVSLFRDPYFRKVRPQGTACVTPPAPPAQRAI